VFSPESGAWGRAGWTRIQLAPADEELVGEALTLAWRRRTALSAAQKPRSAAPRAVKATKRAAPRPARARKTAKKR